MTDRIDFAAAALPFLSAAAHLHVARQANLLRQIALMRAGNGIAIGFGDDPRHGTGAAAERVANALGDLEAVRELHRAATVEGFGIVSLPKPMLLRLIEPATTIAVEGYPHGEQDQGTLRAYRIALTALTHLAETLKSRSGG